MNDQKQLDTYYIIVKNSRFKWIIPVTVNQGLREGSSGGTSDPGLGLGGPGLKGPRKNSGFYRKNISQPI